MIPLLTVIVGNVPATASTKEKLQWLYDDLAKFNLANAVGPDKAHTTLMQVLQVLIEKKG